MASGSEAYDTLLVCGNLTGATENFNEQTKIEEVHDYVQRIFDGSLPESYRIVYYDPTTMSFVNLENQLRDGLNPFPINPSHGVQSTTSATNCIRLYVVSKSSLHTESDDDQIVSSDISDEIHNENSRSTNNDVSQDSSTMNIRPSLVISKSIDPLKRLIFSLDVKSHQRDIYKSDQFSVRLEKSNGRIARVQGRKKDNERMLQVLPKLRIPAIDLYSNVTLLVAVVTEEVKNGMRIWYKHPDKGFLPEGYGKETQPINPIMLQLDKSNISSDGEFTLSLQMITKWAKLGKDREEVYHYDDQQTTDLHPAITDSKSPRLICVLQENGQPDWNTFCLSDFIRTPKSSKQRSPSTMIEIIHPPKRKRLEKES